MNIFFAAQKQTVALDVCAVRQSSATMQQAADITGGIYVRVDRPAGLLQYLLTIFLPDPSLRPKLVLPASGDVDYRPACRCHQKLISVGWVCSVCLTVLCQFTPICLTCQTVFKVLILAKPTKKRKRNI
uniref:General transcription factor IIH subunit 3 n=1 Tax=Plectus sambesii TaxID=2011161 RepID=A0A914VQ97_9BILA